MEDYYFAYKQAVQTANLIRLRYPETGFAIFEEFESYSLLHQLTDHKISTIFCAKKSWRRCCVIRREAELICFIPSGAIYQTTEV